MHRCRHQMVLHVTSITIGSGTPTISYVCAMNPTYITPVSVASTSTSASASVSPSVTATYTSYCADSMFVKISMALLSFGFTSLFF